MKTRKELEKRARLLTPEIDKQCMEILKDVNMLKFELGDNFGNSLDYCEVVNLADSLILFGARLYDEMNGYSPIVGYAKYRGSMTKKVRKAIGFTY